MGFGSALSNTYSFQQLHSRFEGGKLDLQETGYFISMVENTFLNLIFRGSIQKFLLIKVPQEDFVCECRVVNPFEQSQLRYPF